MTGGDWEEKNPQEDTVPNASLNGVKNYIEMIDNLIGIIMVGIRKKVMKF